MAGNLMKADQAEFLEWLKENEITYDYKAECFARKGVRFDANQIRDRAQLAIRVHTGQFNKDGEERIRNPNKDLLIAAINVWLEQQEAGILESVRTHIAYDATVSPQVLLEFVRAVSPTDKSIEDQLQDALAIKHFMWQVKRKLHDMPVTYHLMPVFVGKTGSGKTTAITKFLAPLQPLVADLANMDELADSRAARLFSRFYAIFADEMHQKSKGATDGIKRKITADGTIYRILGTHRMGHAPMNATMIGAAERQLSQIIDDPQGMRRFWQVTCADRTNFGAVQALDYLSLWRTVDHLAEAPWKPHAEDMGEIQHARFRSKSLVEEFLESHTQPKAGASMGMLVFFSYFQAWCKFQGIKPSALRNFSPEVKRFIKTSQGSAKAKIIVEDIELVDCSEFSHLRS